MRFEYQRYEVEPSATISDGILYRPEVPIEIIGPSRRRFTFALLDTGADETVLPASFARRLGIRLDSSKVDRARGAGGHELQLRTGRIRLALKMGSSKYQWSVTVSFMEFDRSEDEVALLGHAGFLEFFLATFDGERREVDLTPNAKLPVES
jgi:hypothetical protein